MYSSDHYRRVAAKLETVFGELNAEQIEAVVAFAKLVRFRARNNNALPNCCARVFSHARFRNVTVQGHRGPYQALEITIRDQKHIECEETEAEAA